MLRAAVEQVYVDPLLRRWVVELVRATRDARVRRARRLGAREPRARARGPRLGARPRTRITSCRTTSSELFGSVVSHRLMLLGGARPRRGALAGRRCATGLGRLSLARAARPSPTGTTAAPRRVVSERARAAVRARPAAAVLRSPVGRAPQPANAAKETKQRARGPTGRATASARSTGPRRLGSRQREAQTSSSCTSSSPTVRHASWSSATAAPRSRLYGDAFPWLDKAAAAAAVLTRDRRERARSARRPRVRRCDGRRTVLGRARRRGHGTHARRADRNAGGGSAGGAPPGACCARPASRACFPPALSSSSSRTS